jgi:hypothetical protein
MSHVGIYTVFQKSLYEEESSYATAFKMQPELNLV